MRKHRGLFQENDMKIAITGTPGTGKTVAAEGLRRKGFEVMSVEQIIESHGIEKEYDEASDSYLVDTEELQRIPLEGNTPFIEGHLSHYTDVDVIVVLRCHPAVLRERLLERGYSEKKLTENVMAEILDVILVESLIRGKKVYEINTTGVSAEDVVGKLVGITEGITDGLSPGRVDWSEEMTSWD